MSKRTRARIAELREHIEFLSAFEKDYRMYVYALDSELQTGNRYWHPQAHAEKRGDLIRRSVRAQRAMDASGVRIALTPPPMFGGPILTNLSSQIIAYETTTYGSSPDRLHACRMVLDGLVTALGSLEDSSRRRNANRRRSPPRKSPRYRRSPSGRSPPDAGLWSGDSSTSRPG